MLPLVLYVLLADDLLVVRSCDYQPDRSRKLSDHKLDCSLDSLCLHSLGGLLLALLSQKLQEPSVWLQAPSRIGDCDVLRGSILPCRDGLTGHAAKALHFADSERCPELKVVFRLVAEALAQSTLTLFDSSSIEARDLITEDDGHGKGFATWLAECLWTP